jgi:hypothetical protein
MKMANLALQMDFLHSTKIFYRHTTSINTLYVIIELLTYNDTPKCHRSPPFSGGGFILPLIRDKELFNIIGEYYEQRFSIGEYYEPSSGIDERNRNE